MKQATSIGGDPRHCVSDQNCIILSQNCKETGRKMDNLPSEIVAEFYDASLDSANWPRALLVLGEALGADVVGLLRHDFDGGTGQFRCVVGLSQEAVQNYDRLPPRSNVWLQSESFFRSAPSVVLGTDLLRDEVVRDTTFYKKWLKPAGVCNHMYAVLERQGQWATLLVLARRESKSPFDRQAADALENMLPVLMRAQRASVEQRKIRVLESAALAGIDAMPLGLVILDGQGAVITANKVGRSIIGAGEGLTIVNGSLSAELAGRRMRLRDLIPSAIEQGGRARAAQAQDDLPALAVPRRSGRRPLTVLVLPIDDDGMPGDQPDTPSFLVFIGDPERPVAFDHARIARLYGLSRAESRVAALLASGYRLEQVAESLGIAYETVRKHLKQIFGKTGTYRQAELVRMLVTGPAGLAI